MKGIAGDYYVTEWMSTYFEPV